MGTPITPLGPQGPPPGQKKSLQSKFIELWTSIINWLSKILTIIAIVVAALVTDYFFRHHNFSFDNDTGKRILFAFVCWLMTFILVYILFSLLKHLILVCLIFLSVWFIVELCTSKTLFTEKKVKDTNFVEIFCSHCNQQDVKLDSALKKLDMLNQTIHVLNNKIDSMTVLKNSNPAIKSIK